MVDDSAADAKVIAATGWPGGEDAAEQHRLGTVIIDHPSMIGRRERAGKSFVALTCISSADGLAPADFTLTSWQARPAGRGSNELPRIFERMDSQHPFATIKSQVRREYHQL